MENYRHGLEDAMVVHAIGLVYIAIVVEWFTDTAISKYSSISVITHEAIIQQSLESSRTSM